MSNQDIVNLIQQTIRNEINKSQQQPQYNRPYYRNNRYSHYNLDRYCANYDKLFEYSISQYQC
jgi:hypothetical protein